jgi:hypothetical protein
VKADVLLVTKTGSGQTNKQNGNGAVSILDLAELQLRCAVITPLTSLIVKFHAQKCSRVQHTTLHNFEHLQVHFCFIKSKCFIFMSMCLTSESMAGGWAYYTDEGSRDELFENNIGTRTKCAGHHQVRSTAASMTPCRSALFCSALLCSPVFPLSAGWLLSGPAATATASRELLTGVAD